MSDVQIQYADKSGTTHEHITHLGNNNSTNPKWTVAQVVAWIEGGENTFFVSVGGKRADVRVRQGTHRKYVQTYADGIPQNNLLSLPPCP